MDEVTYEQDYSWTLADQEERDHEIDQELAYERESGFSDVDE